MKKLTILFLAIFSILFASAQKKQNIYFLKNSGEEVKLKDSADYVRIIEEPDSGEKYFNLKEFYTNGKRKMFGKVSSYDPKLVFEGLFICYNKNGLKMSSILYNNDIPIGTAYHFFENGKIKKQLEYLPKEAASNALQVSVEPKFKLIYEADSLGKVYIKNGNGHLIAYSNTEKDSLIEEGDYKAGFKDGVWKGRYVSGKSSYVESYSLTKFVSGTTKIGDQIIEYNVFEKAPEFKGGVEKFYRYIGNTMRYPSDAVKNNITGTVLIQYVLDKEGKIVDVKVLKSVFKSLDDEARRVIESSPKWTSGLQRGVPIKVKYNIPITFSLGR